MGLILIPSTLCYCMGKYTLVCKECRREFVSYERYEEHIFDAHKDKLYLRLKPEILKRL